MSIPLTSKLPDVGTTIFTVMSQLAADSNAINLSQGFPSFDPPEGLIERIEHYLRGGANQYAPMTGVPTLRQAIADKMQKSPCAPARQRGCLVRSRP
jgi:methionine aminotransferase